MFSDEIIRVIDKQTGRRIGSCAILSFKRPTRPYRMQSIAAQPVQDRSPLVFFSASPAPDPDQSSSHWQYVSVAGVLSLGFWCLPGRRHR